MTETVEHITQSHLNYPEQLKGYLKTENYLGVGKYRLVDGSGGSPKWGSWGTILLQ